MQSAAPVKIGQNQQTSNGLKESAVENIELPLLAPTRLHAGVAIKRGIHLDNAPSLPSLPTHSTALSAQLSLAPTATVIPAANAEGPADCAQDRMHTTPGPTHSAASGSVPGSFTQSSEDMLAAMSSSMGAPEAATATTVPRCAAHVASDGGISPPNADLLILSDEELWRFCGHGDAEWAYRYAAYHHFRSKAWCPAWMRHVLPCMLDGFSHWITHQWEGCCYDQDPLLFVAHPFLPSVP